MDETKTLPEVVYTSESRLRSPARLLSEIVRGFREGKDLAWSLFVRDISATYRRSFLGFMWAFLPPVILAMVFVLLKSRQVLQLGQTDIPYPVYVVVGVLLWHIFVEALNTPRRVFLQSQTMLSKIHFPWEALILTSLYQVLFSAFIKSLIITATLILFQTDLNWGMATAPLGVLLLILLGGFISLLLTPAGMVYDDVWKFIGAITPLWFFATPVIYPPFETFPYSLTNVLNPVSPVLTVARDLFTKGAMVPSPTFFVVTGMSVMGLLAAVVMYRLAMPVLIERMGT